MPSRTEKKESGIYLYHARHCALVASGGRCSCKPTYQATFYNRRDGRVIKKHFDRLREAKNWRADLRSAAEAGKFASKRSRTTVADALDEFIAGIEDGSILNRSDRVYKPSACRSYKRASERLKGELGHMRLQELRRADINAMVQRLRKDGLSASTIRNTVDPLRALYRGALDDEIVSVDPTHKLRLPASTGGRDRTASPVEAERLIDALPESEQALWAVALYIGLRRGELQELRWRDVDLESGIGRCVSAWDDEGKCVVATKTRAGERMFPLVAPVRRRLVAHKLRTGRGDSDLVFGRSETERFSPSTVNRRAKAAWNAAGLDSITLHEGRHSAATSGSAAGLDDLALAHIMGHSSVVITRDRYGHVRPDRIEEVCKKLDDYYDRYDTAGASG